MPIPAERERPPLNSRGPTHASRSSSPRRSALVRIPPVSAAPPMERPVGDTIPAERAPVPSCATAASRDNRSRAQRSLHAARPSSQHVGACCAAKRSFRTSSSKGRSRMRAVWHRGVAATPVMFPPVIVAYQSTSYSTTRNGILGGRRTRPALGLRAPLEQGMRCHRAERRHLFANVAHDSGRRCGVARSRGARHTAVLASFTLNNAGAGPAAHPTLTR